MSAEVWAGVRALASAAQRRSEPPKARAIAGVDPEGAAAQKQKRREKRLRIFTGEARAGRCVRAGNSFRVKAGSKFREGKRPRAEMLPAHLYQPQAGCNEKVCL